jgi:site-specific DNA-methyltransferase (adenine-specific)
LSKRDKEVGMQLLQGNCLDVLKEIPDNSVDSIVTDPPYGLSFMGKKWDYDVPSVEIWKECLRVLKPGGHLLAFAGTRTQHRMAVRIEDAGFEIRDMIAWVYGSGFPKSLDISKQIDKAAGAEREVVGRGNGGLHHKASVTNFANWDTDHSAKGHDITAPAPPEAKQWDGWGTSLKPSFEPITIARKPLIGTVAANVLAYGTGGINIDGCRVETEEEIPINKLESWSGFGQKVQPDYKQEVNSKGRWPANLILTYPEDQYILRDDVTPDQFHKLAEWMNENAKC